MCVNNEELTAPPLTVNSGVESDQQFSLKSEIKQITTTIQIPLICNFPILVFYLKPRASQQDIVGLDKQIF